MATSKQNRGSGMSEPGSQGSAQADAPGLPAVRPPVPPGQAEPEPARFRRRLWVWMLGLVLAAGGGLGLYLQPWAPATVAVTVEIAGLAPVTRVLAVNGRIAALHSVDLRALVGGTLSAVEVAEGDAVQRGAVLARIDAASQQAVLRQAAAGLDTALVAEARARDALTRAEALAANIPRTELEAAERALQTALQEVARTTALLDQAQVQLGNFTLHAPMTGTVLALNVEPGQTIDPATVLMTIADLDRLVVETDVDEAYATQIRRDQPAVLQLAGESEARAGRVSFVSQRVDAGTGGLAVRLEFDDPVLAPVGLTVTTNIVVDRREAAITAPRAAIEGGDAVFVVIEGVARRRAVTVIDWPAARLIVTAGLEPGDVVIVDAAGLADGVAVRVEAP